MYCYLLCCSRLYVDTDLLKRVQFDLVSSRPYTHDPVTLNVASAQVLRQHSLRSSNEQSILAMGFPLAIPIATMNSNFRASRNHDSYRLTLSGGPCGLRAFWQGEIGRASCRERV